MSLDKNKATALFFRLAAHVVIAALAITLPGVGPNRFWVAGILIGIGSPLAVLINLRVKDQSRNWAEALLDLVMIVTVIHLVPHLWMVLMCLGLMVALAPSVTLHPASHWIYLYFGILLIVGMTLALIIHDVEGWILPLLAVAVTYPSMLYYTYSQMQRHNEIQQRADMVAGMTQLAGSVAHDFNNMLTTISGHAELAQRQLDQDHAAWGDIHHVLQGAERASLLSRQLLSFSGRDIELENHVDLAAEAQTIAGLMTPVVPAGVVIRVDGPEHLWVSANISQVNQILMNLILNAGEAMIGQTGEIVVSLAQGSAGGLDEIQLSVKDTGPGRVSSGLKRFAEPFAKTKPQSHGVGLAATRKTVEEMGGSISFQTDSQGTLVLVSWKQETLDPNELLAAEAQSVSRESPTTILVVEDEASVRKVAVKMLTALNLDVLEAGDAFQAMDIFREQHPRISAVLLDLKMPKKDGWACLAEMREISPHKPVLICSGYDPQEDMRHEFADDAHLGFLKKPYRIAAMEESLASVLVS